MLVVRQTRDRRFSTAGCSVYSVMCRAIGSLYLVRSIPPPLGWVPGDAELCGYFIFVVLVVRDGLKLSLGMMGAVVRYLSRVGWCREFRWDFVGGSYDDTYVDIVQQHGEIHDLALMMDRKRYGSKRPYRSVTAGT